MQQQDTAEKETHNMTDRQTAPHRTGQNNNSNNNHNTERKILNLIKSKILSLPSSAHEDGNQGDDCHSGDSDGRRV